MQRRGNGRGSMRCDRRIAVGAGLSWRAPVGSWRGSSCQGEDVVARFVGANGKGGGGGRTPCPRRQGGHSHHRMKFSFYNPRTLDQSTLDQTVSASDQTRSPSSSLDPRSRSSSSKSLYPTRRQSRSPQIRRTPPRTVSKNRGMKLPFYKPSQASASDQTGSARPRSRSKGRRRPAGSRVARTPGILLQASSAGSAPTAHVASRPHAGSAHPAACLPVGVRRGPS